MNRQTVREENERKNIMKGKTASEEDNDGFL